MLRFRCVLGSEMVELRQETFGELTISLQASLGYKRSFSDHLVYPPRHFNISTTGQPLTKVPVLQSLLRFRLQSVLSIPVTCMQFLKPKMTQSRLLFSRIAAFLSNQTQKLPTKFQSSDKNVIRDIADPSL